MNSQLSVAAYSGFVRSQDVRGLPDLAKAAPIADKPVIEVYSTTTRRDQCLTSRRRKAS